ncbi:MAG: hypothetical protein IIZ54_02185 [Selenomonadaceae bacterium]|nr:hypothetical protein [Selenomonadaceae bacterium]
MPDRPDWNAIKIEYISGTIGQRKLAEKYGVPFSTLRDRACSENWLKEREKTKNAIVSKAVQRKASLASENAITAERIRKKLLARLEREIDEMPEDLLGTLSRQTNSSQTVDKKQKDNIKRKESSREYRFRDMTAALKDLMDGFVDEGEKDDNSVKVIIDV